MGGNLGATIKGANGEKVYTSEMYTRKQKAQWAAKPIDPDISITDLTLTKLRDRRK